MDENKDGWTIVIAFLKDKLKIIDQKISSTRNSIGDLKQKLKSIPKDIEKLEKDVLELQNNEDVVRNALKEYNLCPECHGSGLDYKYSWAVNCTLCQGRRYIIPEPPQTVENVNEELREELQKFIDSYNKLKEDYTKLESENGELKKVLTDRE